MPCYTCGIVESVTGNIENFVVTAIDGFAPGASTLFAALLGVWLAWTVFYRLILKPDLDFKTTAKSLALFMVVLLVLRSSTSDLYLNWIYLPITNSFVSLSAKFMEFTGTEVNAYTLPDMLLAVEDGCLRISGYCRIGLTGSGILDSLNRGMYAFWLTLPYLFTIIIFLIYVIEFYFKLGILSALAPIFIALYPFRATRGCATGALKMMIQGGVTIALSVGCMGLMLSAMKHTFTLAMADVAQLQNQHGAQLLLDKSFLLVFALGLLCSYFQMKTPAWSSNLLGVSDSSGPASMVAAVATGGIASMASMGGRGLTTLKNSVQNTVQTLNGGSTNGDSNSTLQGMNDFSKHS